MEEKEKILNTIIKAVDYLPRANKLPQSFVVYYFMVSGDQEFECSLAGWLCLKVYDKAAIKVSARMALSSEGSTEGGSASKLSPVSLPGFHFSLVTGLGFSSFLAVGWRLPQFSAIYASP